MLPIQMEEPTRSEARLTCRRDSWLGLACCQVTAVEEAAVEYLADRLDPGNVLIALALGAHLSDGQ